VSPDSPDHSAHAGSTVLSERVQRICQACVVSSSVSGAGVSLSGGSGNVGVLCATDEVAGILEELQFTLGEGPCVQAAATGAPVLMGDLDDPTAGAAHWPAFRERATASGVRAVFAFPVRIGAIGLGTMDLYRDTPGALTEPQLRAALVATDTTAGLLLDMDEGRSEYADGGNVRSSYLLTVHQASGMIQVQLGVSIQEALSRLRATAYAQERPINEVAQDVVERKLRFRKGDA
jgi:hypothetical protein